MAQYEKVKRFKMASPKKVFNYTLDPEVVENARKQMEKEKKKQPKISLSQVVEGFLFKYGNKKP